MCIRAHIYRKHTAIYGIADSSRKNALILNRCVRRTNERTHSQTSEMNFPFFLSVLACVGNFPRQWPIGGICTHSITQIDCVIRDSDARNELNLGKTATVLENSIDSLRASAICNIWAAHYLLPTHCWLMPSKWVQKEILGDRKVTENRKRCAPCNVAIA